MKKTCEVSNEKITSLPTVNKKYSSRFVTTQLRERSLVLCDCEEKGGEAISNSGPL